MVDFDHAVRMNNGSYTKHGVKNISGNIMAQVRRFPSERSLSEYTLALDRKYPLYVAKEHTLMRSLLRHIDNPQD